MAEQGKNFGDVIAALKAGGYCRRAGWNGSLMFVYRLELSPQPVPHVVPDGKPVSFDPCYTLFTARKTHQPGWNASQPDMEATDWEILTYEDVIASLG
jgi:hypothetical protein